MPRIAPKPGREGYCSASNEALPEMNGRRPLVIEAVVRDRHQFRPRDAESCSNGFGPSAADPGISQPRRSRTAPSAAGLASCGPDSQSTVRGPSRAQDPKAASPDIDSGLIVLPDIFLDRDLVEHRSRWIRQAATGDSRCEASDPETATAAPEHRRRASERPPQECARG